MKAIWQGEVIADSDRTVKVDGYCYFPREAVRMELLVPAAKSDSDLVCPHGVQFFDVARGDLRSPRNAWSYEAPRPSMEKVDHWIGFWKDVKLED